MNEDGFKRIPEGTDYLNVLFGLETKCEATTAAYLPDAGKKAPLTWACLGTNLAILDALSSCWWGCHGGDHVVEYLVARTLNSVRGTVRLARAGLYDESLNMLRTGCEIVNLLTLFQTDATLLENWRVASPNARYTIARPTMVMQRLAAAGRAESSMNPEKYDILSRIAHGNTSDAPQAHNPIGLPLTSGTFQEAGFLTVLNETALTVTLAILAAVQLIDLERKLRRSLLLEARALMESIGGITLTTVNEALGKQRDAIMRNLRTTSAE